MNRLPIDKYNIIPINISHSMENKIIDKAPIGRRKKIGDIVYYNISGTYVKGIITDITVQKSNYSNLISEAYVMDNGEVIDWSCCTTYDEQILIFNKIIKEKENIKKKKEKQIKKLKDDIIIYNSLISEWKEEKARFQKSAKEK